MHNIHRLIYFRYEISNRKLKLGISLFLGCKGGDSCCTSRNRCDIDQGDCDSDSDCKIGLKCGKDNCPTKSGHQWDSTDDCCYKPMPGQINSISYELIGYDTPLIVDQFFVIS